MNRCTQQCAGAADEHPASEDACELRGEVGENYREECTGEGIEQERGKSERDGSGRPLLARQMKAATEPPGKPRHQREAYDEERDSGRPWSWAQDVVTSEPQRQRSQEPDQEAGSEERTVHIMNMNISS